MGALLTLVPKLLKWIWGHKSLSLNIILGLGLAATSIWSGIHIKLLQAEVKGTKGDLKTCQANLSTSNNTIRNQNAAIAQWNQAFTSLHQQLIASKQAADKLRSESHTKVQTIIRAPVSNKCPAAIDWMRAQKAHYSKTKENLMKQLDAAKGGGHGN